MARGAFLETELRRWHAVGAWSYYLGIVRVRHGTSVAVVGSSDCGAVGIAAGARSAALSSKVGPVDAKIADLPVTASNRRIITSQYDGSYSIRRARRPDFCAAIRVVPDPPNGSRTISARRLQSLMASLTRSTGLTVGWSSSSSRRPVRNVFTPAYSQTLVLYRPVSPKPKVLTCGAVPTLNTNINSCFER